MWIAMGGPGREQAWKILPAWGQLGGSKNSLDRLSGTCFRGPVACPHANRCPRLPAFKHIAQTGSRRSHLSRRTSVGLVTPGSGPEWARQQQDGAAHADRAHQGWPATG
jgi:hypothetical protein